MKTIPTDGLLNERNESRQPSTDGWFRFSEHRIAWSRRPGVVRGLLDLSLKEATDLVIYGSAEAPRFQCQTLPEADWNALWLVSCNRLLDIAPQRWKCELEECVERPET